MANITLNPVHARPSLLHLLAAPFRAYMHYCEWVWENDARLKLLHRLQAMSDAELAERGLKRDGIVDHVFHGLYYA